MVDIPRLTPQTIAVLRALSESPATARWGRDIAKATGLKSGTLHPILSRLEHAGLVESYWEAPAEHEDTGRPRRRYYRFTSGGAQTAQLAIAEADAQNRATNASRLRPQPGY
jgi:DNA-binding PadR family transcriptional regulator